MKYLMFCSCLLLLAISCTGSRGDFELPRAVSRRCPDSTEGDLRGERQLLANYDAMYIDTLVVFDDREEEVSMYLSLDLYSDSTYHASSEFFSSDRDCWEPYEHWNEGSWWRDADTLYLERGSNGELARWLVRKKYLRELDATGHVGHTTLWGDEFIKSSVK